jgi:hypothetical protein
MAGILQAGGSIDNAFDIVRGSIGKADTTIQAWFHDKLSQSTSRYDIQQVLWQYGDGIKAGRYGVFSGYNDPNAIAVSSDIINRTGLNDQFVWNVLMALYESRAIDPACALILNGNGGNIFDDLMNGGPVKAFTNVVNDTLDNLGLPSLANTVVILLVVGIIGVIIYFKVIRK